MRIPARSLWTLALWLWIVCLLGFYLNSFGPVFSILIGKFLS